MFLLRITNRQTRVTKKLSPSSSTRVAIKSYDVRHRKTILGVCLFSILIYNSFLFSFLSFSLQFFTFEVAYHGERVRKSSAARMLPSNHMMCVTVRLFWEFVCSQYTILFYFPSNLLCFTLMRWSFTHNYKELVYPSFASSARCYCAFYWLLTLWYSFFGRFCSRVYGWDTDFRGRRYQIEQCLRASSLDTVDFVYSVQPSWRHIYISNRIDKVSCVEASTSSSGEATD